MSRREPTSELDLQALFERRKVVPRQPVHVRARVLARARATVASPMPAAALPPVEPLRWQRYLRTPAASLAVALGLVGVVYALSGRWSRGQAPGRASSPANMSARSVPAAAASGAEPREPASASSPPGVDDAAPTDSTRPRSRRSEQPRASSDAELRLMRGAHTAYAAHAFASALALVNEHARRFPAGLLAEEREALRVRCLLGSGRTREAERAAAAFAKRFPRSVFVPRVAAAVAAKGP